MFQFLDGMMNLSKIDLVSLIAWLSVHIRETRELEDRRVIDRQTAHWVGGKNLDIKEIT